MITCPREGCPCIYHGDEEIHIAYHAGSSWCLKCGHRIKDGPYATWLDRTESTRNPYLLKTIQIIRPNATDGGNSECPSENLKSPQRRETPAIADMTTHVTYTRASHCAANKELPHSKRKGRGGGPAGHPPLR